MTLMRWTPNPDLAQFQDEVNRLFHGIVVPGTDHPLLPQGWLPAVDVHETAKDYTVQMDLPGVNPKHVKVEVLGDQLTIRGERRSEREAAEGSTAHRVERTTGAFERTFRLASKVDASQVKASYKDGVLSVRVPKAPESFKREIPIDVG